MSTAGAMSALGPSNSARSRREWMRTVTTRFNDPEPRHGESEATKRLEKTIKEVGRFAEALLEVGDPQLSRSAAAVAAEQELNLIRERELARAHQREHALRRQIEHEREMAREARHGAALERERLEHEARIADRDAQLAREEEDMRQQRAETRARDKEYMNEVAARRHRDRQNVAARERKLFDESVTRAKEGRLKERLLEEEQRSLDAQREMLRLRDRVWERERDEKRALDAEDRDRRLRERARELDQEADRRARHYQDRDARDEQMLAHDKAVARERFKVHQRDIEESRRQTDVAYERRQQSREEDRQRGQEFALAREDQHAHELARVRARAAADRRQDRDAEWGRLRGMADHLQKRDEYWEREHNKHMTKVERNSEQWVLEQKAMRERERVYDRYLYHERERRMETEGDFEAARARRDQEEEMYRSRAKSRQTDAERASLEWLAECRKGFDDSRAEQERREWEREQERRRKGFEREMRQVLGGTTIREMVKSAGFGPDAPPLAVDGAGAGAAAPPPQSPVRSPAAAPSAAASGGGGGGDDDDGPAEAAPDPDAGGGEEPPPEGGGGEEDEGS